MRTTSVGGAKYFVIFVDDYLKKVWVYTMKYKGEWCEKFKEFQALVEMQSEYKSRRSVHEWRGFHFEGI